MKVGKLQARGSGSRRRIFGEPGRFEQERRLCSCAKLKSNTQLRGRTFVPPLNWNPQSSLLLIALLEFFLTLFARILYGVAFFVDGPLVVVAVENLIEEFLEFGNLGRC